MSSLGARIKVLMISIETASPDGPPALNSIFFMARAVILIDADRTSSTDSDKTSAPWHIFENGISGGQFFRRPTSITTHVNPSRGHSSPYGEYVYFEHASLS